jgi:ABC-2 type transport system permease protein
VGLTIDASSLLVLLVAIPASACLFIALGVVIAGFTIVFKEITALLALVSSGLAVFAGVYFPISVLPGALHGVASALPFTWALELLRAALLGGDVSSTKMLLLVLCAAAAVPISFWLFDRSVARAKRAGSLAQY